MKDQWFKIICLAGLVILVLTACQPAVVATQAVPAGSENQGQPTDAAAPTEQTIPAQGAGDEKCRLKQSVFPAVKENDWIMGPKEAKITILEYSDFM